MDFVGRSAIKINRAARLTDVGRYPGTFARALDHIPQTLRDQLTAAQIAAVIDAVDAAFRAGRNFAGRNTVAEGGIWDESTQKFRKLED